MQNKKKKDPLVQDGEVNLLTIMEEALYSIKNIMIEEKSSEIEGNRFL